MSSDRLFQLPKPQWLNSATTRAGGIYFAGALFSIALFTLIDVATFSKSERNASSFHITFVDWIPGIFSALGMLIINSIDKSRLSSESGLSGDVAWQAKVILFTGFAGLAGGLAGSVTILVLKYVVPDATWPTTWMGIGNVVANGLVMLSSIVLWISQNIEDDYTYNLAL